MLQSCIAINKKIVGLSNIIDNIYGITYNPVQHEFTGVPVMKKLILMIRVYHSAVTAQSSDDNNDVTENLICWTCVGLTTSNNNNTGTCVCVCELHVDYMYMYISYSAVVLYIRDHGS